VDLQHRPQAWIQPQLPHLHLPDGVVGEDLVVVPVRDGGVDRDAVEAVGVVDAVGVAGGPYVHDAHGARDVRDVAGARDVVDGLGGGWFDGFEGGGVVCLEGLGWPEEAVASAAFGLVSDLAFGLVSGLEFAPAFDLASGQAGFGAALAGCRTLNPLYF